MLIFKQPFIFCLLKEWPYLNIFTLNMRPWNYKTLMSSANTNQTQLRSYLYQFLYWIFPAVFPWLLPKKIQLVCTVALITSSSCLKMFCKTGVLKILQNSQENTCDRVVFLIKLQAEAYNIFKKETDIGVSL